MSAHVLSNFFNKLGKSDKMRGLPSILWLFCNKFNKFNDTGVRMLDSLYHMTLKLLCNHKNLICLRVNGRVLPYIHDVKSLIS